MNNFAIADYMAKKVYKRKIEDAKHIDVSVAIKPTIKKKIK